METHKNVKEILTAYLTDNGFDGLYCDEPCGCRIGDLVPCGQDCLDCKPGYLSKCPPSCGEHDWHISGEVTEDLRASLHLTADGHQVFPNQNDE